MFAHAVRGPVAALADSWKEVVSDEDKLPPKNVIDCNFRQRLYAAGELAKNELATAQNEAII